MSNIDLDNLRKLCEPGLQCSAQHFAHTVRPILPALLADHARLEADLRRLTVANKIMAERITEDVAEEWRLISDLTAERDAHQATRDALARERAEVAKWERCGMEFSDERDTLLAEVARLRGLLDTPHEPEPRCFLLGRDAVKRVVFTIGAEETEISAERALSLGAALIRAAIRKEAAGE